MGFILNSEDTTVTLSEGKQTKIKTACFSLKRKKSCTIRELAQVIGTLVAAFPALRQGPLYYRDLDKLKTTALKKSWGNFEATVHLSEAAERELDWWIANVSSSCFPLDVGQPTVEIETDASSTGGWGAVCNSRQTGGRWNSEEKQRHINVLEMLAIEYALKSFKKEVLGMHVKLLCDNTCAVSYIRNMGGSKSAECNEIAHKIWVWCLERQMWLTISHIP